MISREDILKASILIVDDQEANVSLLEQMLHDAGYVSIASTMEPREVCELHRKNHYGLINMKERARKANGEVAIDSVPGKGTTVALAVKPLPRTRGAQAG